MVARKGDITLETVDAIVNPANSYGFMGGGVALAIKKAGGDLIEEEAVKQAPTPLGKAILTTGGLLPSKYVIHSPTMFQPVEKIGLDNIRISVRAALECALEHKIQTLAFPGMGMGVGGVNKDEAAKVMVEEIKSFIEKNNVFDRITLVGFDEETYRLFEKWMKNFNLATG